MSIRVIGDREAKKLEKLMAKEAKAEEKNIKHARADVKKAEKAVKKSVKAVEKAQKEREKTLKKEHAAVKALNKAKHKHADAHEHEVKAEESVTAAHEKEEMAGQGVRQARADLDGQQLAMEGNAQERMSRLADVFAHLGEEGTVPSSAQLASNL